MSTCILYVEDDHEIGRMVTEQLNSAGYRCEWVHDGAAALQRFADGGFDLVLLDLMLPSMDGLDLCRRIRATDLQTPLVMLTARAAISDVVTGLEMGADDYITKPFSMQVLIARLQALLRRHSGRPADSASLAPQPIIRGRLMIDPLTHIATLDGATLDLTAKEFALLLLFASHPGRSFSRGELLDRVWGPEFEGFDHTVNTHINRLRSKIEDDPAQPKFILTVWGVGYRFAELEALDRSRSST